MNINEAAPRPLVGAPEPAKKKSRASAASAHLAPVAPAAPAAPAGAAPASKSPLSLDALLAAIPKAVVREAHIDASAYFGQEVEFVFSEPDAAGLFRVPEVANAIKTVHPDWPDTLCQNVALLGTCHKKPDTSTVNPNLFYTQIASENRDLLMHLITAYTAAFPATGDFNGAVDEKKSDSKP